MDTIVTAVEDAEDSTTMIDATTETEMTTTAETETTEDLLPGDLASFGWIEDIVN